MKQHRGRAVFLLVAILIMLPSWGSSAHEVPAEITVDIFLKPEHQVLRLLIRVPLSGLMGMDLPKEGIGYLALDRIQPSLDKTAGQIAASLDLYEGGRRLEEPRVIAARVALPFDTSFNEYQTALSQLTSAPLPADTQIYWLQGAVEALVEYPIQRDTSDFAFHTRLTTLAPRVTTALRFLPADGSLRSFAFPGDPGRIWLDPHRYQTGWLFVVQGVRYVVALRDQWLFVFCMLIAWRRLRSAPAILGAFGVGQATASLLIAYGPDATGVWLPPLVDAVAAAFLVGFAIENIVARRIDRRRTTLAFGAVTGVGLSIAMRDIAQFAGLHRLTSILSFAVGVQIGAVALFAVAAVPVLLLMRVLVRERLRTLILSALVANLAWNAFTTRVRGLGDVQWPLLTPEVLVTATSWLLVFVVAGGVVWFLSGLNKPAQDHAVLSRAEEATP